MAQVAASEGATVGCMLAGDYNSAPGSPLYHFLQNGELDLNQYDKHTLSGEWFIVQQCFCSVQRFAEWGAGASTTSTLSGE